MAIVDELIAILGYETAGQQDLERFSKGLDSIADKAKKLSGQLGRMSAVAGAAVAAGFTFLGKSVLDTSAKFESYLATLETIEGSADKAKASFDWLKDFAKTTPYEIDELTSAFIKLRSYGMDPMDGSLTTMGNTASAMGKSLDQVVEAIADATTGQFERMKELGFRASQAGDQVTFAWTESGKALEKTVKKNSVDISKFIYEVWDRRFGGAMEKQAKTWSGMMSNIGDTWIDFQQRIGEAGFFEAMKKRLQEFMNVLDNWDKDGTLDKVAKTLSSAFTVIADAVGVVVNRVAAHIKFLNENWESLESWVKLTGVAFGLMIAAAFPLTTILVLLAIAVDDLLTYLQGGESVIGAFIDKFREFLPFSEELQNKIMGLSAVLVGGLIAAFAIMPHTMFYLVGRFMIGPLLRVLFWTIPSALASVAMTFGPAILAWGPKLIAAITGLSAAIMKGFTAAFALLSNPIGWAIILAAVVAALVAYFWDDLVDIWNSLDFGDLGRKLIEGVAAGVRKAGSMLASAINKILPERLQIPVSVDLEPGQGLGSASEAGANVGAMGGNMIKNMEKLRGGNAAAAVQNDNSTNTQTTNVDAPITVNIKEASQAPAAVGNAIQGAVNQAAPSRIQSGSAMQ